MRPSAASDRLRRRAASAVAVALLAAAGATAAEPAPSASIAPSTATFAAPEPSASASAPSAPEPSAAPSAAPSPQEAPPPAAAAPEAVDAGAEIPPNPALGEQPEPELPPVAREQRARVVVQTILGLVALLGLAYLGGHPRVRGWERTLGVSQLVTAGFPFVALGLLARSPAVGILSDPVLVALRPVLRVGLGWIGFLIGFRFDARAAADLRPGTGTFVAWRASLAFASIAAAAIAIWLARHGLPAAAWTGRDFVRPAIILATAGSLTSLTTPVLLADRGGSSAAVAFVARVVRIEEVVGIIGLLGIAAYFRSGEAQSGWQLPGTAWVLLTLGAGVTVGLLVYAILLRAVVSPAESLVLTLGSVAFASGLAGDLRLSPVVVCFVAGFLLANLPGDYKDRLAATLSHLERPIYLLFLVIVGALWDVTDAHGWVLMAAFVAARVAGKWAGTRAGAAIVGIELERDATTALVAAPMGALSIAIVVNAAILYPRLPVSSLVTTLVGGAIATEVIFQVATRSRGRRGGA